MFRFLALLAAAAVAAGCGETRAGRGGAVGQEVTRAPEADDPTAFGDVPDFRLIAHTGQTVTLETLRGRPFVVAAIFTRCYGPCPRITRSMRRLQDELADTDVMLVSISVDPEFDTTAVLAAYAELHGADPERWLFLTGGEEDVYRFVREGLWLGVDRAARDDPDQTMEAVIAGQVTHATDLVAVDRRGRRRGWYDGEDEAQVARCRERMLYLVREGS